MVVAKTILFYKTAKKGNIEWKMTKRAQVNRFLVNERFKIEFVKNVECNNLFQPVKYLSNKSIEAVIKSAGDISDISTCAANTTATGPGITTANPGRKATFTITSHDSRNFQRKRGGDVFVVKLKPEVRGDDIKVELKDRKDGTYLAEYTVDRLYDELTLSVCLRGANIKGSPFAVNVKPLIRSNSPEIQGAVRSKRSPSVAAVINAWRKDNYGQF